MESSHTPLSVWFWGAYLVTRRKRQGSRPCNFSGSRGRITVLDRPKLEARACECYAVVKKEFDRLLPDVTAT